jgi:hypothetical protein
MITEKPDVLRILNCIPSKDTHNDWTIAHAPASGMLMAAAIPTAIDLRESWWKIGDQGSTGSCVGWALADSLLRWHFVKAGIINRKDKLSVRFPWMAAKETDEFSLRPSTFIESDGTSLKAALDVARLYGAVRDAVLPFSPATLYQGELKTFYALASQLKIASYFNLGSNLQNWRTWLATNGPILVRLDVDNTWMNAGLTQGRLEAYQKGTQQGGHAVALVGYTSTTFIVRNSWGTRWGNVGFGYASLAYAQVAFTEAYGVKLVGSA